MEPIAISTIFQAAYVEAVERVTALIDGISRHVFVHVAHHEFLRVGGAMFFKKLLRFLNAAAAVELERGDFFLRGIVLQSHI